MLVQRVLAGASREKDGMERIESKRNETKRNGEVQSSEIVVGEGSEKTVLGYRTIHSTNRVLPGSERVFVCVSVCVSVFVVSNDLLRRTKNHAAGLVVLVHPFCDSAI
mmetsp:Transcript_26835/g.57519  ORF Transcript_26835/g.57519 Transcript_26835/m.57519 type:complete len:108 (+) Transcript_26835:793-1116(+)